MTILARTPYQPRQAEWSELYSMLCGYCSHQGTCDVVEGMIEMKYGAPWPAGGWVRDPGAGVSCLSYAPKGARPLPRQQMRKMLRQRETDLPPVCGGCAARTGSDASVTLHTRRDFQASVRNKTVFLCHEDPEKQRLCGGWCRAIRAKNTA